MMTDENIEFSPEHLSARGAPVCSQMLVQDKGCPGENVGILVSP